MSDYTDFTYLDYHNNDEGQRRVDPDAIDRAFSQAGASYYGDGSEFIVGYDANGGAMIDSDAVRAAARRKAEEAAESKRGEEALLRLLMQQRQAQANSYLYRGRDVICYPLGGKVYGMHLLHKSGSCPYLFNSAKLGPFVNEMDGMIRTFGSFDQSVTTPCPYCFRMRDMEDAEDTAKMDAILSALKSGKWQKEHYTLSHPAPPKNAAPAKKAVPSKKAVPAKAAAPKQKTVPVYKKTETSTFLFNRPEKGSLEIKTYKVTVNSDCVWMEVNFVSPLPMRKDSWLDVANSLKISYVKKGLFGPKTVTVLPGELKTKDQQVREWDEYEGAGYGYRVYIQYRKWEMNHPGGTGHYTMDVAIRGDIFKKERVEHLEGDLTVGKR